MPEARDNAEAARRWVFREGERFANVVGLPDPWPPQVAPLGIRVRDHVRRLDIASRTASKPHWQLYRRHGAPPVGRRCYGRVRNGFEMTDPMGTTAYGCTYCSATGETVTVNPTSGRFDVVAEVGGVSFVAECKGGVINTRHPGQQSRLRQGLCETIGLSLASPITSGRRQSRSSRALK
jgi:hypothetical protein